MIGKYKKLILKKINFFLIFLKYKNKIDEKAVIAIVFLSLVPYVSQILNN